MKTMEALNMAIDALQLTGDDPESSAYATEAVLKLMQIQDFIMVAEVANDWEWHDFDLPENIEAFIKEIL